ncbi:MAG TPA: MFS transporter [Candidatus Dormibacteraeota bacterium]|nr:MFS transporter [Candidatus Dormibacteraeota bacterium]
MIARLRAGLPDDYYRYWVASVTSNLGDGVRFTAIPVLTAAITRDPLAVAVVSAAGWRPWLLVALPAGVLVDRVDRVRLMTLLQVVRFAIASALTLSLLLGIRSLGVLAAAVFVLGMCEVVFDSAAPTLVPAFVAGALLPRANARLFAGEMAANEFVGPPLGGLLFGLAAPLPFVLDAASFGAGALLLRRLRGTSVGAAGGEWSPRAMAGDLGAGLAWLWRDRLVGTLSAATVGLNLSRAMTLTIFVLFALRVLRLSAFGFGLLWTATAVGAVAGSWLIDRAQWHQGYLTLVAALVAIGGSTLAVAFTDRALVVALATAALGFATMVWNVTTMSIQQRVVPDRLLGRVTSVWRFLTWGSLPVGSALGGVIAQAFGLSAPFLAGGVLILAMAVPFALVLSTAPVRQALGPVSP